MTDREQCFAIYRAAFGDSGEFDTRLFGEFFDCCKYIKSGDTVASMLFALPCTLCIDGQRYPCRYIYAAATEERYRGRGYMTSLLSRQEGTLILKPADDSLIEFYNKCGFRAFTAVRSLTGERYVEADGKLADLAAGGNVDGTAYTAMIRSELPLDTDGLCFAYTME